VVLSSCESGLPQDNPGPEPICLAQAFQLAGASSVVASLWPVDDEATLRLFQGFYRHLRGGTGELPP
jgi:CHAT domain-containing protein